MKAYQRLSGFCLFSVQFSLSVITVLVAFKCFVFPWVTNISGRREDKRIKRIEKNSQKALWSTSAEEWVINESQGETFNFLPQALEAEHKNIPGITVLTWRAANFDNSLVQGSNSSHLVVIIPSIQSTYSVHCPQGFLHNSIPQIFVEFPPNSRRDACLRDISFIRIGWDLCSPRDHRLWNGQKR